MQKIITYYLQGVSLYMDFALGALTGGLFACLLHTPFPALSFFIGGFAAVATHLFLIISSDPRGLTKRVKKYWLKPTERCAYELGIGSAALVFGAAFAHVGIFETAFLACAISFSLIAYWRQRGVFDASVLL